MRGNDIFRDFDFLNPWQNFYVSEKIIDLEWLECATVHNSPLLRQISFEHGNEIHDHSIHIQSYEVVTPGTDARVREALKKQPLEFPQHSLWISIQEILKSQQAGTPVQICLRPCNIFYLCNEHTSKKKEVVVLKKTPVGEWTIETPQYDKIYWPTGTQVFSLQ